MSVASREGWNAGRKETTKLFLDEHDPPSKTEHLDGQLDSVLGALRAVSIMSSKEKLVRNYVMIQMNIDEVSWEERFNDLLEECRSPAERDGMLAARKRLSYSWMNAIPHAKLSTCMDNKTVDSGH